MLVLKDMTSCQFTVQERGLLSQYPLFCYILNFSVSPKYMLVIEYQVLFWQKLTEKFYEQNFSDSHPRLVWYALWIVSHIDQCFKDFPISPTTRKCKGFYHKHKILPSVIFEKACLLEVYLMLNVKIPFLTLKILEIVWQQFDYSVLILRATKYGLLDATFATSGTELVYSTSIEDSSILIHLSQDNGSRNTTDERWNQGCGFIWILKYFHSTFYAFSKQWNLTVICTNYSMIFHGYIFKINLFHVTHFYDIIGKQVFN